MGYMGAMKEDINELKTLLKVMEQAKHAALQREGFAVEERDKARELFQTAMELAKKYKDERDECQVEQDRALKAWTEAVSERTAALLERDEARAEVARLRSAIENFRDVKGRHNTKIACERLLAVIEPQTNRNFKD